MLRHRILLGAIFIAALAALFWLDSVRVFGAAPGIWLLPLALLLCLLASDEILRLTAAHGPSRFLVHVGNLILLAASSVPMLSMMEVEIWRRPLEALGDFAMLISFVILVMAAFVREMLRYKESRAALVGLATTIFCLCYVGLLLGFVVRLRVFDLRQRGLIPLVSLIVIVKMGDSGEYFIGRLIGRHKMTPRLSPGKTWEGFAGAMLFAVLGSWAVFCLLDPWMNSGGRTIAPWRWIAYGLIVGIAGLLGDLAESLIKRDAGRKDSSPWMPGFGGVLDVLDSILFAAPVAFLCWAVGLVR